MAKNKVSDWSATPANNTDIGDINIAEGCAPSNINNAIRELMAQVKDMQTGADADNFVIGGALTCSGNAVFSGSVSIPTTPLGVTSGGTGLATMAAGDVLYASAANTLARLASASTTTSVLLSGNTAPTWGKVALTSAVSGTLPIANGGTGQTTATAATNALLPSQSGNSGKFLTTDGTDTSWATVSVGSGSVTSVSAGAGMNFTTITTSGSVDLGTPSTLGLSTTNQVTGTTHTHQVDFPVSSVRGQLGDTALASGNIVLADLLSFGRSLNSNGYQKLPGGLIIQWGNATISGTTTVVSFSTAFSVACYSVVVIPFASGDTGGLASAIGISSGPTKTGCVFSTDAAATALYFIAVGQ